MAQRKFKNWIEAYLRYTAHSEAPERFHRWTAIWTIAGAMRRKSYIDMGYFRWYPNFFVLLVAPPGVVSKSTTADIGKTLLKEVPGVRFGPSAVTWQSLVYSMAHSTDYYPVNPLDTDPMREMTPMSALSIAASELGTFLDPKNREMIDVLNDLWDGKQGVWEKETKHSGDDAIENPWINIIGCTTPSWIADNFTTAFIGGGFASRTVFIYSDKKRRYVPYPKEELPKNFDEMAKDLIHDLEIIAEIQGEYALSPGAIQWGSKWYTEHFTKPNQALRGEQFQGYLARKQTHLHKAAMVIAASQREERVLIPEDLQTAEKWLTEIEKDMPFIYGQMNRQSEAAYALEMENFLMAKGKVKKSELAAMWVSKLNIQTFQNCLMMLIESHTALQVQEGNEIYVKFLGSSEDVRKRMV